MEFDKFYCAAPDHLQSFVTDKEKISLGNVGILRQYPYGSHYNINFRDDETHEKVIDDLHLYKKWCGGNCTIVENTTHGILRNLKFYRECAEKTGVNIIAGTGHYVEMSQSSSNLSLTMEQLTDLYARELVTGVDVSEARDGSDMIKCGFLGEIGSSWPITGRHFVEE